ncbi:hypothetical protein Hanom_Chr14g01319751 [Helianthus anomalus]
MEPVLGWHWQTSLPCDVELVTMVLVNTPCISLLPKFVFSVILLQAVLFIKVYFELIHPYKGLKLYPNDL